MRSSSSQFWPRLGALKAWSTNSQAGCVVFQLRSGVCRPSIASADDAVGSQSRFSTFGPGIFGEPCRPTLRSPTSAVATSLLTDSHFGTPVDINAVAQDYSSQAVAKEQPKASGDIADAHKRFSGGDKTNIKAQLVFEACWRKLEGKWSGKIQCPHEIVWLNGAPGAGKGANTPFIMKSRGLSRSVPMSDMLERNPQIKHLMEAGELVPDTMVGDALLDIIFAPEENDGVGMLIDGFPRTALQVDFLKLLYDKMLELHNKHADGPEEWQYPRPSFKVVVLYVEMEESVKRQMLRATMATQHNKRAADAGSEDIWNVRTTDVDAAKCRRRYEVFRAHYATILRLKQYFPFSLIDAMGGLEDTRAQISRELRYQSSLDLDEATYAAIRHLPLAQDLVRASRQQLVHRLDTYSKRHHKIFMEVVRIIDNEAVPLLKRCSLAGHATLKSPARVFSDHPLAADMCIDILSDRGFCVAHTVSEVYVPSKFDLETGEVHNSMHEVHYFRITFEKEGVRQLAGPAAAPSHGPASAGIGQTYVPSHLDRESRLVRHHNPNTGFISSRPQPTVVAPNGDEMEPDGTVTSHQAATAAAEAAVHKEVASLSQKTQVNPKEEQSLQKEVQRVTQDIAAEGKTPASNPDKARVQSAWDSHYVPDAKKGIGPGMPLQRPFTACLLSVFVPRHLLCFLPEIEA
ncbi:hypothetical protein WJX77_008047 [Trebouxia sp. C0004]